MTTTERAVRKASRERLLRDFARAARQIAELQAAGWTRAQVAGFVMGRTSRTRYACLMTAFGQ